MLFCGVEDKRQNNMDTELSRFVSANKLPCFACLQNGDSAGHDQQNKQSEEIYFYRVFKAKYFVAKCYASAGNSLNSKWASLSYLDNESDTLKKKRQNLSPLKEIFIPFHYQGEHFISFIYF